MDATTRKAELKKLRESQLNQKMTGIPLRYKGTTREEIVWRIPLDYLIYNKYNGRIGSDVLSYEKQNLYCFLLYDISYYKSTYNKLHSKG